MFALPHHAEAGLLEGTHRLEMGDARELRQGSRRDFDLADRRALEQILDRGEVLLDGVLDVLKRFLLRGSL